MATWKEVWSKFHYYVTRRRKQIQGCYFPVIVVVVVALLAILFCFTAYGTITTTPETLQEDTLHIQQSMTFGDDDPSLSSTDHTDNDQILPEDAYLIFVHVGKTGGTSLDTVLRSNCEWYQGPKAMEKCYNSLGWMTKHDNGTSLRNDRTNEPLLSRLTHTSVHLSRWEAELANATHFMVSARNPLARAVSAFNFDHPSNQEAYKGMADKELPGPLRHFYAECFPTVEKFVRLMWTWTLEKQKGNSLTKAQEACYKRGNLTLAGDGSKYACSHFRYNYQFYGDLSFLKYRDAKILVLRTEKLWEDTKNLDLWLGGDGVLGVGEGSAKTYGSEGFTVKSGLTAEWTKVLCCFMAHEIQLYEDLIRQSLNLMESEKAETLAVVYGQCGVTGNILSERFDWDDWKTHHSDCIP